MKYKYVIRKTDEKTYIPYIKNKDKWMYLIYSTNFMVSNKKSISYTKLKDAYKFIASHRMGSKLKGKNRLKCLYFNKLISMIPIIGIFYTIPKIINIPIPILFNINHAVSFIIMQMVAMFWLIFLI